MIEHPIFLVIPTSATTLIIQGAYIPLTPLEWGYALCYTTALLVGLSIWAYRAFRTHILKNLY